MSRAFIKDETVAEAVETVLPERPISPHPNLVTAAGLKALEEADPAKGLISYVSPVARALIGQPAEETVAVGGTEIAILQIS